MPTASAAAPTVEAPPPDSLAEAVGGLRLPNADQAKRRREALLVSIRDAFAGVLDTLSKAYAGTTGRNPPSIEAAASINEFYRVLHLPYQLKEHLHKLRKWRNAAEHGIELEDGTRTAWVDHLQGPPMFPAREEIKLLVQQIEAGGLADLRSRLAFSKE